MTILALETSSARGSLAVLEGSSLRAEHLFDEGILYGRGLVAGVGRFLDSQSIAISDLEGVLVSCGPGSFTGIRLGVTVAKTFAFALQIPVEGASSLEVLAAGLLGALPPPRRVLTLLDARQGQFFWASFRSSGAPTLRADGRGDWPCFEREVEDRVDTSAAILRRVGELTAGVSAEGSSSIHVVGDGADRFLQEVARREPFTRALRELDWPAARVLGKLCAPRLEGALFDPRRAHALEPRYLRLSEAERRLAALGKASSP